MKSVQHLPEGMLIQDNPKVHLCSEMKWNY